MHGPHLRGWGVGSHLPEGREYLRKLFVTLLYARCVSFSHMYLFNRLYQLDSWLIYTLGYNVILGGFCLFIYLFFLRLLGLAIRSAFHWLLCPLDMFRHGESLSTCLLPALKDPPGSSGIICSPSLTVGHLSKNPQLVWLENGDRNQDLDTRCAHCQHVALLLRCTQLTEGKGVSEYQPVYTHIC